MRRAVGIGALLCLCAICVPMVAAGREVVQAAGRGGDPGWILGLFGEGFELGPDAYLDLERAAFALYVVVVACASAIPRRLLWGAIAALVAAFTLAPPLLSLDVFGYISYERLEVLYDLNPYEHAPADAPGDEALAFIERWRGVTSAYGPLFTMSSLVLGHIDLGAAVWTLKAVFGLSVLGIVALVARTATLRGEDARIAAAVVALNPLVLVHIVGGAHNDALMMLAATAGVWAVVAGRDFAGGAAFVTAAAIKVSASFAAPFALIGSGARSASSRCDVGGSGRRIGFLTGALTAAIVLGGLACLHFGTAPLDSLELAGENQELTSRYSVPATIARELGIGLDGVRHAALAAFALLVAGLLAWTWRGGDWIRAAGWAGLGLLVATSFLTPWYTIWVLPFAALSRDRFLIAGAIAFTGYQLLHQVIL